MRRAHRMRLVAVMALCGLAVTACGTTPPEPDVSRGASSRPTKGGGTGTTVPEGTTSYQTGSTLSIGLVGSTTNWNILARQAPPPAPNGALQTVADAVWPSAFVTGPGDAAARNTNLLVSATEVSTQPEKIVYTIDSRATWSDGTPITGADFIYTWEAQSGRFHQGGHAFTPASTAGYSLIRSVTSNATTDPDRVVVTFRQPYADWQGLFDPIIPAHVAKADGFNHGFTDPVTSLISGGPFVVQSYQPGASIVLVHNPRWWGAPPNLSVVDITFLTSYAEAATSLEAGELDATVTDLDSSDLAALEATGRLATSVTAGGTYDDLVANEHTGVLARRRARTAVLLAAESAASATLPREASSAGYSNASLVTNRALVPTAPGYRDNSASLDGGTTADPVGRARLLLTSAGFRYRGATLYHAGRAVTLTLDVATAGPFARDEAAAVVAGCHQLGISVTVSPLAAPGARARVAAGTYSLAIVATGLPSFPSSLAATYRTGGTANVAGYSSPAMNALLSKVQTLPDGAARTAAVNAVDQLAWSDAVDLPLLAQPTMLVYQARYANLVANTGRSGIGWDIAAWGIPASP